MKHLITAPNTWKSKKEVISYIKENYSMYSSMQLFLPRDWKSLNPDIHREYDLGFTLAEAMKDKNIITSNHEGGLSIFERLGIRFGSVPKKLIDGMVSAYREHQPSLIIAPNYLMDSLQERLGIKPEVFVNPYCSPDKNVFKHGN